MSLKRLVVCVLALGACRPSSAVNVEGQAAAAPVPVEISCNAEAPIKGKWGYAKRGTYCEGLLYEPKHTAPPFEPYSFMAGKLPEPAILYRITWPAVRGPVTIAAVGVSGRHSAKYRLNAAVQGPFFDWPTEVLRVARPSPELVAKATEIVGGSPQTVYLAVSVIDPHDDDEPLPQPPQYSFMFGDPGPLKSMAVSLTRLTTEGTPAGAAIPVRLYRTQHDSDRTLRGLGSPAGFPLDFTRQPAGLYRVRMKAVDETGTPVEHSWLVRPAL